MKYVALLTQSGEGCDYTIACSKKFMTFEADTDADAHKHMEDLVRDEYASDDYRLSRVQIFRIAESIHLDLDRLYYEIDEEESQEEAKQELARAEEKLKQAQAHLARLNSIRAK